MFYQCPKCQKNWQYPISKCPECFENIERVVSEKAKVVGVSKVNIPTIQHPKIPYFVLVLEDENGNKYPQKSLKEYRIGDEFAPCQCKGRDVVAIWLTKYDVVESIEKIINLLPDIEIKQQQKILILPTLLSPKHPYFAINTNPKVLDGLLKYLIQTKGIPAGNITVADNSFNEMPIEVSAKKSGLLDVGIQNMVSVSNLADTKFKRIKKENFVFDVSEIVFNQDLIINLPIMKLDSKLGVRGASINVAKLLKKESYLGLKYLLGEEKLAVEFNKVLPKFLTIADCVSVQKTTGTVFYLGMLLAGFNPLNLDRVFASIVMKNDLPNFLKSVNLKDVLIAGRTIEEVQFDVEKV